MSLVSGQHFVAGSGEFGRGELFTAIDASSGAALAPDYREASDEQIDRACAAAAL